MRDKYIFFVFLLLLYILLSESKTFNENNLPVIIWWTNQLFPHIGKVSEIKGSFGKCISSTKRVYKNKQLLVTYLFYGSDFDPEILPLPRNSNHIWALLHEESPMNNYIFSHTLGITLFNFTGTFSRYSDFPVTSQYIPSLEYFTERQPMTIGEKNKYRKKKLAPILCLQSHCNIASDRDTYIRELMQFIDIDSCGTCLHNKDLPEEISDTSTYNDNNLFEFIKKYKFHIAFENALCDDYVTEKLFRPLYVGSVPIYKGSSTGKDWLPDNKSAILIDDFSSPKELAEFITVLDNNDDLYEEYLTFKKNGVTNDFLKHAILNRNWGVNDREQLDFLQAFESYLCDQMYTLNANSSSSVANRKHMNCFQPHPSIHQGKADKMWQQEEWIENYWFGFDKAKAIHMMIENKDNDTSKFLKYIMNIKYKN